MSLLEFVREEFTEEAVRAATGMEEILLAETLYLWGADYTNGMGSLGYRANSAAVAAGLSIAPYMVTAQLDSEQRELYRALGGTIEFDVRIYNPLHEDNVWRGEARELRADPKQWGMNAEELEAVLESLLDNGDDHVVVGEHHWFLDI